MITTEATNTRSAPRTFLGMSRFRWQQTLWAYGLLAPALVFFLVVNIIPTLKAFSYGFLDWNLLSGTRQFIGLGNYTKLLRDAVFLRGVLNSILYTVITVPAGIGIALILAVMLNTGLRGSRLLQTIYFMPFVTSLIAVSFIWLWLYEPTFGLLNATLTSLGFGRQPFLASPRSALASISVMKIWKYLGFQIVLLLAGLQGIPDEYYEAAALDGSSPVGNLRHITIPLLNPVLVFLTVVGTIKSMETFAEIFVMTDDGGPLHSTRTIVYHMQQTAFRSHQMGYGAAMTVVLFVIVLVVTLIQLRWVSREIEN